MKRGKKIIINSIVVVILLCASCYFSGFYLTKNACVTDFLKSLDREKETAIINVEIKDKVYVLTGGQTENQYSVLDLTKAGFLYRSARSNGTFRTSDEEDISLNSWFCQEDGQIIFIKRNNPEIRLIEMEYESGITVKLYNWTEDFVAYHIEDGEDLWKPANYRCYDTNDQMVYEIKF